MKSLKTLIGRFDWPFLRRLYCSNPDLRESQFPGGRAGTPNAGSRVDRGYIPDAVNDVGRGGIPDAVNHVGRGYIPDAFHRSGAQG